MNLSIVGVIPFDLQPDNCHVIYQVPGTYECVVQPREVWFG